MESLPFAYFSILQKNYEHFPASVAFFAVMRYDKRYVYRHFTKTKSNFYDKKKGAYHGKQYCRAVP